MALTHSFQNPLINLHLSPFTLYLLIDRGENLKSREALKIIERRKTVTGNIFSLKAFRKELVVGGHSRKDLKKALGNANLIAEVLNSGSETPEYLYAHIEYDFEDLDKTANQIRHFIKELCERDIESLKTINNPALSAAKKEFILQLSSLQQYLDKEILKSGRQKEKKTRSISLPTASGPLYSNFRNGLREDSGISLLSCELQAAYKPDISDKRKTYKGGNDEKFVSFTKKTFIKALSGFGVSYEEFADKIREISLDPIINIKDSVLRIKKPTGSRSRLPILELEINNKKKESIKIGTKAGCLLYGSILYSLYQGKRFKRSDLVNVAKQVKNKYRKNGNNSLSQEDKDSIPLFGWFHQVYKAVFGEKSGTFEYWCIEEFKDKSLTMAATLLKDNIESVLKDDLEDFKDLLLIQKQAPEGGGTKQLYWIKFPIEQVDFSGDNWKDLVKQ